MAIDWIRAFPRVLALAVTEAEHRLPNADLHHSGLVNESYSGPWPALTLAGEVVEIPYRIYHPPLSPSAWDAAAGLEPIILACMYSRHHDGHVRQAAVRRLLDSAEPFTAPFVVQLLGEYVVEIVLDIANRVDDDQLGTSLLLTTLSGFARENPSFMALTEARAASYWAEYYRSEFLRAEDYPALAVISRIGG